MLTKKINNTSKSIKKMPTSEHNDTLKENLGKQTLPPLQARDNVLNPEEDARVEKEKIPEDTLVKKSTDIKRETRSENILYNKENTQARSTHAKEKNTHKDSQNPLPAQQNIQKDFAETSLSVTIDSLNLSEPTTSYPDNKDVADKNLESAINNTPSENSFPNHTLKRPILAFLQANITKNYRKKTSNSKNYKFLKTCPTKAEYNTLMNAKKKEKIQHTKQKKPLIRLILFFIMLITALLIGYKIISKGIFIENIQVANITIQNIFLQLQDKLILQIEDIDLSKLEEGEQTNKQPQSPTIQTILDYTQKTLYMLSYFQKFEINNITLRKDQHWQIQYANTQYKLRGPSLEMDFTILNNKNSLYVKINNFQSNTIALELEGDFIYSIPSKQLYFDILAFINKDTTQSLSLKGSTDFQALRLNAKSTKLKDLEIIRPFIDDITNKSLRKTLQDWIFNNVNYTTLQIDSVIMDIRLNNLANTLLNNMHVQATLYQPHVILAKELEPITGKQVTLEFKERNLYITPLDAKFAGANLSDSKVIIANISQPDILVELYGSNIALNAHTIKLLEHYGIDLPIRQNLNMKNHKQIAQTNSTNKKTTKKTHSTAKNTNSNIFYNKIAKFNPKTTLTKQALFNPNSPHSASSLHLKISILHNTRRPKQPLFFLQGIIQTKKAGFDIYQIPFQADTLDIALDITPTQKFVYVDGKKVKWYEILNADIDLMLDLDKQNLQANSYIHKAVLNTNNLNVLKNLKSAREILQTANNDSKLYNQTQRQKHINTIFKDTHIDKQYALIEQNLKDSYNREHSTYFHHTEEISQTAIPKENKNSGIYVNRNDELHLLQQTLMQNMQKHQFFQTNTAQHPKSTIQNDAKSHTKPLSKDNGKTAFKDEKVLKTLKNNPVWDDLKIRTKQTRPFQKLTQKELEALALQQIEQERENFFLEHDFLNIQNSNLYLQLSFANQKIILDIPSLSLHLESANDLKLDIAKIENILQYSPLARYYGITHGNFNLHTTKEKNTDFTLNLTHLQHPIYTITHKRVQDLSIKGMFDNGALIMIANDNIDFKSYNSLSMLRINGYRINADEAFNSNIPFLQDLFKDKQQDDLPYSEEAIAQELRLIAIKNKLRKKMKVNPVDFNIIGENLQLTFMGYTAPFDSTNIRFIDGQIILDGQYGKGILNAHFIKDSVTLDAKNFSDNFINIILTSIKDGKKMVDGGTFSLDALYRNGILNASLELQNTAFIEFKTIQNIFALIDTVPSLFMFKDPQISNIGYHVKYGKVLFARNRDYLGLQNIFLLGSSMDVNGQGIIDLDTQEINVNLSISTIKNLSKFINKIPIIGYLMLGREGQISTNLILTEKYTDPKVNITLAADIIKAPFNILRRIFPTDVSSSTRGKDIENTIDY